jgi:hypothetical protein
MRHFEILLFSLDVRYACAALRAGVSGVIVDWECVDKDGRQKGYDTEINRGGAADLHAMRAAATGPVLCRINNHPDLWKVEVRRAIALGADEIWLPMVRTIREVETCLDAIDGRVPLGVLVETRAALDLGRALSALPITRVYIGLNDLHIDQGRAHPFEALVDGTLDTFRDTYDGALGFGGVTLPELGHPLPQALLLAAMARLGCRFGVARRSFRRDVPADRLTESIAAIGRCFAALSGRSSPEVARDHEVLRTCVHRMCSMEAV